MKSYTLDDLARMIDHTNLHTDASPKDMRSYVMRRKNIILPW